MSTWKLDEGLALARALQPESRKFGYHLTLGGSVLNLGVSEKDLDLYFLPLDNGKKLENGKATDIDKLVEWLSGLWGKPENLYKDYLGDEPGVIRFGAPNPQPLGAWHPDWPNFERGLNGPPAPRRPERNHQDNHERLLQLGPEAAPPEIPVRPPENPEGLRDRLRRQAEEWIWRAPNLGRVEAIERAVQVDQERYIERVAQIEAQAGAAIAVERAYHAAAARLPEPQQAPVQQVAFDIEAAAHLPADPRLPEPQQAHPNNWWAAQEGVLELQPDYPGRLDQEGAAPLIEDQELENALFSASPGPEPSAYKLKLKFMRDGDRIDVFIL